MALRTTVAHLSTITEQARATVSGHDCLFESVADHSSLVPSRQLAYREPFSSKGGLPHRAAHCQGPFACDVQTAELPEGFGLKPFSARTEVCLCFFGESHWI